MKGRPFVALVLVCILLRMQKGQRTPQPGVEPAPVAAAA
jgi:hypothetical protein